MPKDADYTTTVLRRTGKTGLVGGCKVMISADVLDMALKKAGIGNVELMSKAYPMSSHKNCARIIINLYPKTE